MGSLRKLKNPAGFIFACSVSFIFIENVFYIKCFFFFRIYVSKRAGVCCIRTRTTVLLVTFIMHANSGDDSRQLC